MDIAQHRSHSVSVYAGQGEILSLREAIMRLADEKKTTPDEIIIACKDDFHQTAAHIAAKAGQTRSIEALAELFTNAERKATYFNMANRFSGDRPVHTAMRHGHLDVFKAVVRHGGDPTASNRFGDKVGDYEGDFEPDEVQAVIDEYLGAAGSTGK